MLTDYLRRTLLAYEPTDAREFAFRARMLELCDKTQPFSRSSFFPGHFTASAFVLSPHRDALLLIFHKKLGRWLQPGGHIETGDATLIDAARREVAEETAIVGPLPLVSGIFDIDVHDIPARKDEPCHEHFDIRVLLAAPALATVASEEVAAVRWVPLGEVAGVETDESVLRAVRKILALSGATANR
jgi:8-oxo-dGTP pyrophosphatase MutT (NUDIX family)